MVYKTLFLFQILGVEYLEDWANFCANNFGEILDLLQVSSLSYTDSGIPEGLGYDADQSGT